MSQFGQMALQLTDTAMVGHYSNTSLAASAFAGSVYAIFLVFGMATTTFVSTLVSQAYGAGQHRRCGEILRHALVINLFMAIGIAALIELGIPFLFIFGQDLDVLTEATPYLSVIGWSSLPIFLFQVLRQYSEALNRTLPPLLITIAAIGLNALLNWMFIFGNFGMPELGLLGAGYATLVCRLLMVLGLAILIFRDPFYREFFPSRWLAGLQQKLIQNSLKIGLPAGFQGLFEVGTFAMAAVMMGWVGVNELAAHQVALSLAATTYMFALGISFAATILVGNAYGRGRMNEAKKAGASALLLGLIVMGFFGLVFAVGHELLPRIYSKDAEILKIASVFMIWAAVFQIFDGTQIISLGCLRGLSDLKIPTWITGINYGFFALPLAYVLGFHTSLAGVGIWVGLSVGLMTAAIALSYRFIRLVKHH